jgi:hypothetical protein
LGNEKEEETSEKEEETREKGAALGKRRDFSFICCVDKMRRERNIGKRKRSQKISLYFV